MPDRNWKSPLPESSDELDALIAKCQSAAEIREVCLKYARDKQLIVQPPDGVGGYVTGKTDDAARTFSKIVTLPNGRRMILEGARSQAELDAVADALEHPKQQ